MRRMEAAKFESTRTNFFTLLRFDFMVDEHLDTYLIEVRPFCRGLARLFSSAMVPSDGICCGFASAACPAS